MTYNKYPSYTDKDPFDSERMFEYQTTVHYYAIDGYDVTWYDPYHAAGITYEMLCDYRDSLISQALYDLDGPDYWEYDTDVERTAGYAMRVAKKADNVAWAVAKHVQPGEYCPVGWTGEMLHDLRFITTDNGFSEYTVADAQYVLDNTGADYIDGGYFAIGIGSDHDSYWRDFEWSRDVVFADAPAAAQAAAHDDSPFV